MLDPLLLTKFFLISDSVCAENLEPFFMFSFFFFWEGVETEEGREHPLGLIRHLSSAAEGRNKNLFWLGYFII